MNILEWKRSWRNSKVHIIMTLWKKTEYWQKWDEWEINWSSPKELLQRTLISKISQIKLHKTMLHCLTPFKFHMETRGFLWVWNLMVENVDFLVVNATCVGFMLWFQTHTWSMKCSNVGLSTFEPVLCSVSFY